MPNQPQIAVALKATSDKKSNKSANLLLNENESDEEMIEENKDTFKDPCYKLTTKIIFMINFLRLDLTYAIVGLLNNKMWTVSPLNKVMIKQLHESFFSESVADKENIRIVFDKIFDEFKSRVQKIKDFLQISLHLRCIPQLVRAIEDGIFECMIPLAFSTKSKNVFSVLTSNIDNLFTDAFNFIEESGFGKEIVNRSVKALRFMPYVRSFIHLTQKEVEEELKKEKSGSDGDFNNNIILLNIVLQVITPVPLPKSVNPNYIRIKIFFSIPYFYYISKIRF